MFSICLPDLEAHVFAWHDHCCGRVFFSARDSLNGAPSRKRQQEWPSNCVIMLIGWRSVFFFETAMLLAPLWGSFFANRAKKNGHTEMFKLAIGCRPGFFKTGCCQRLFHLKKRVLQTARMARTNCVICQEAGGRHCFDRDLRKKRSSKVLKEWPKHVFKKLTCRVMFWHASSFGRDSMFAAHVMARTAASQNSAMAARWSGGRVTMGAQGRDRRVRDFPQPKSKSRLLKTFAWSSC